MGKIVAHCRVLFKSGPIEIRQRMPNNGNKKSDSRPQKENVRHTYSRSVE